MEHKADAGKIDQDLGRLHHVFIVLAESAVATDPSDAALPSGQVLDRSIEVQHGTALQRSERLTLTPALGRLADKSMRSD